MKKNKGVTLVVLVITIIILLILASISIVQLTQTGLFEKAKEAKRKYSSLEELESETIGEYENAIKNSNRAEGINKLEVGKAVIPSGLSWRRVYVEFKKTYTNIPYVFTQVIQSNIDFTDNSTSIAGATQWEVDNITKDGFYISLYNNSWPKEIEILWQAIEN